MYKIVSWAIFKRKRGKRKYNMLEAGAENMVRYIFNIRFIYEQKQKL